MRPFSQSARVSCRSYSTPLQRIITDFGADVPFGRIPKKLQEHYGISVESQFSPEDYPKSCCGGIEETSNSDPDSGTKGS